MRHNANAVSEDYSLSPVGTKVKNLLKGKGKEEQAQALDAEVERIERGIQGNPRQVTLNREELQKALQDFGVDMKQVPVNPDAKFLQPMESRETGGHGRDVVVVGIVDENRQTLGRFIVDKQTGNIEFK